MNTLVCGFSTRPFVESCVSVCIYSYTALIIVETYQKNLYPFIYVMGVPLMLIRLFSNWTACSDWYISHVYCAYICRSFRWFVVIRRFCGRRAVRAVVWTSLILTLHRVSLILINEDFEESWTEKSILDFPR